MALFGAIAMEGCAFKAHYIWYISVQVTIPLMDNGYYIFSLY